MAHPAPGCREDADRHHRTHRHAGQELPRPALREVRLEIPRLEHSGDTRLEHSTPGWSYPVWNNPHQSALLSDLSNCHKPPRVNPVVGDPRPKFRRTTSPPRFGATSNVHHKKTWTNYSVIAEQSKPQKWLTSTLTGHIDQISLTTTT